MSGSAAGGRFPWRVFMAMLLAAALVPIGAGSCDGDDGSPGPTGASGFTGTGSPGSSSDGPDGITEPLSSMVAVRLTDAGGTGATNLADFVKARVNQVATGTLPAGVEFPLANAGTDTVRAIDGLSSNIVVSWLQPLTFSAAPTAPRYGANCDYIAYFGEGWDAVAGDPPQWKGSGTAGWVWNNHEYISNNSPRVGIAPTGQMLTLAKHLQALGILTINVTSPAAWTQTEVDIFIRNEKKELGGSWFRIIQDPATDRWVVDRTAAARRFDATSNTLLRLTGHALNAGDTDDTGAALPAGVVAGILGDCSGGQTPWGTVITAEENVQDYYGDLESCWNGAQKFLTGQNFDPGGNIAPTVAPATSVTAEFGRISTPADRHNRDVYGWLAEMDPTEPANNYYDSVTTGGDGKGHSKMGPLGRARWENATIATDANWKLVNNQPIVIYTGQDRRGGRIYKWVSTLPYTTGMTKGQIRALLDTGGYLYVGQFDGLKYDSGLNMVATNQPPSETVKGTGKWILLSVNNTVDNAPNAGTAAGPAGTKVGAALMSQTWNGIGGFPDDNAVRNAMFTAEAKIGIAEMNRPEDLEWNPVGTPRLYFALTNHNSGMQTNQAGELLPTSNVVVRTDVVGAIWVLEESNPANPGPAQTFTYWQVWAGVKGTSIYDAGCADNIAIDKNGGVWFGTDGNFGSGVNGKADAIYYLDLNAAHKAGQPGVVSATYGKAFRVIAAPSDAEATGPCFTSDMRTLFFNAQHPGEAVFSTWP